MPSSRETKQANELRALLREQGVLEEKLHGNMFQSGLPDILLGLPREKFIFVETKSTLLYTCSVGEVMKMLRPAQRRFFIQYNRFPVYVVVFGPQGVAVIKASTLLESGCWHDKLNWRPIAEIVEVLLAG